MQSRVSDENCRSILRSRFGEPYEQSIASLVYKKEEIVEKNGE